MTAGRVTALARHPVKSLGGEELAEATFDARGLAGDRLWSVRDADGRLGSGKTSSRFRRMDGLLLLSATYDEDVPVVTFPDGRVVRGDGPETDAALSRYVGRTVSLTREGDVPHFDDGPVHLVTTASLATLARAHGNPVPWRHSRANLLLDVEGDGFPEHDWVGRRIRVGPEVVLRVRDLMERCVMVDAAQAGVDAAPGLLKRITDVSDGALGVWADVEQVGTVRVGAEVTRA